MTVKFAEVHGQGATTPSADYEQGTNTLTISVDNAAATTYANIKTALASTTLNGSASTTLNFAASNPTSSTMTFDPTKDVASATPIAEQEAAGQIHLNDTTTVSLAANAGSTYAGAAGNIGVILKTTGGVDGAALATYAGKTYMVVSLTNGDNATTIANTINNAGLGFTATAASTGANGYSAANDASTAGTATATFAGTHAMDIELTSKLTGQSGNFAYAINVIAGAVSSASFDASGKLTLNLGAADGGNLDTLLATVTGRTGSTMTAATTSGTHAISWYATTVVPSSQTGNLGANLSPASSYAQMAGGVDAQTVAATTSHGAIALNGGGVIQLAANTAGSAGNINVVLAVGTGTATTVSMVNATNMVVSVGTLAGQQTTAAIANAINNANLGVTATEIKAGTWSSTNDRATAATSGALTVLGTGNLNLSLTSNLQGSNGRYAYNINVNNGGGTSVSYDSNGKLTLNIDNTDTETVAQLLNKINTATGASVTAASTTGGATALNTLTLTAGQAAITGNLSGDAETTSSMTSTSGGANAKVVVGAVTNTGTTATTQDFTFMVSGAEGASNYQKFTAGTDLTTIAAWVNQNSDATGVTASTYSDANAKKTYLVFQSSDYGTAASVGVKFAANTPTFTLTNKDGTTNSSGTAAGTDIQGTVNGIKATGAGNTLSVNSSSLVMSMTVNAPTTTNPTPSKIQFTITGGGATFQLGPDVSSTEQTVLGIHGVNSSSVLTSYGRLDQIKSGQDYDLQTDATTAGKIVNSAVTQIATLRGQLGAFQNTTLQTNIDTLTSTLNALTDAHSNVTDADFAAETANLTRAQILVQSGTAVLKIANQAPQNVLSLLQ
jgi:flagellin